MRGAHWVLQAHHNAIVERATGWRGRPIVSSLEIVMRFSGYISAAARQLISQLNEISSKSGVVQVIIRLLYSTVKLAFVVIVPPGVVMVMGPVVAPAGTVAHR
jgi:acyl-CoA reductase-like NAD-dependent aldehyde dehydrogenase